MEQGFTSGSSTERSIGLIPTLNSASAKVILSTNR
jgi:hypothetical protein